MPPHRSRTAHAAHRRRGARCGPRTTAVRCGVRRDPRCLDSASHALHARSTHDTGATSGIPAPLRRIVCLTLRVLRPRRLGADGGPHGQGFAAQHRFQLAHRRHRRQSVALGELLHLHQVPSPGGDTLFASMYAAYEELSEPMRVLLDALTAYYSPRATGYHMPRRVFRRAPHPVARTHPATGRKALFVNAGPLTTPRESVAPKSMRCSSRSRTRPSSAGSVGSRIPWRCGTIATCSTWPCGITTQRSVAARA